MSGERFVSTQFCDDIRQEVGDKWSLMGCYGSALEIAGPLPSALPKLCASVKVYTPISRPFAKLTVRICSGDRTIAEMPFPADRLTNELPIKDGAQWRLVIANFVLVPFPIEGPVALRVEAETEEDTLHGGTFWINPMTSQESDAPTTLAKQ